MAKTYNNDCIIQKINQQLSLTQFDTTLIFFDLNSNTTRTMKRKVHDEKVTNVNNISPDTVISQMERDDKDNVTPIHKRRKFN